ncbi:MAG TPA: alpha/beta hydrolase [Rhizomicrobium sp.]|jgi:pimeloyl-ACP methyl ester carboxylesterase|nr:alpha/beta hydrolase [Rhizomicrobium sp.]
MSLAFGRTSDNEAVLQLRAPGEPTLLVRHVPGAGPPVLYVHGATFPSALSVAYRFNGRSWMDDLGACGFDVWAFDFAGFGGSDRPPTLSGDRNGVPTGRAIDAAAQIARVVQRIMASADHSRVSLVAHSWGSMPAGLFAGRHPDLMDKLCLFGPLAQRDTPGLPAPESVGAWRLVGVAEQLARFVEDVPPGHAPVLIEPELETWGPAYLASDPEAERRTPPAVKIPTGPVADILAAWSGKLAWRPEEALCPVLIVRGEWDSVSTNADANWLLSRISSPVRQDTRIPNGTHLLHLEQNREALFAAVGAFLRRGVG